MSEPLALQPSSLMALDRGNGDRGSLAGSLLIIKLTELHYVRFSIPYSVSYLGSGGGRTAFSALAEQERLTQLFHSGRSHVPSKIQREHGIRLSSELQDSSEYANLAPKMDVDC